MKIYGVIASCLVVASVVQPTEAYCRAWCVEQDGSGEYLLIQDAVNAASDGDTILIGPGRYDDLQPRGFNNVVCVARWDDGRGLTFIGEHRDSVIIGPTSYVPSGTGPQGIHQHEPADLRVENLSFVNLLFGVVAGRGALHVENSRFECGDGAVVVQDPLSCSVARCLFVGLVENGGYGVMVFRALEAEISGCEFDKAPAYFGGSPQAVVRDCVVTAGEFINLYQSGCRILRSTANCTGAFGIAIDECDTIRIEDSTIIGGLRNVTAGGAGTVLIAERNVFRDPTYRTNFDIGYEVTIIAHDNDIYAGAGMPYVVEVCCYPVGTTATIDIGNNYWGEHSNAAALDSLIYDANDDPSINVIVAYEPIRTESVPVKKKSLGSLKSLFLGR